MPEKRHRISEETQVNKDEKYEELNKVSYGTAIADINELIRFNYVERVGFRQGAYYVLNEEKVK